MTPPMHVPANHPETRSSSLSEPTGRGAQAMRADHPGNGQHPADQLIAALNPTVIERVDLPARQPRFGTPPKSYCEGAIGAWLAGKFGTPERLYRHQALALNLIEAGRNVVISTATASGKSLVFMAPALRELLTGDGRCLVFYPQKALGGDQLTRWREEMVALGLDPDLVGEITGDVPPSEREQVLEHARVILATPDALHAWMMRMLTVGAVRSFLQALRFIAIDEAHALEAVFGSQFAFFFRRLRDARLRYAPAEPEPQVIAATATLHDPIDHLRRLTGMTFALVGDDENGAPSHGVTLLHIDGPEYGASAEKAAAAVLDKLAEEMPPDKAVIGFADSRQGVERIVDRVGRDDILPYRGGFSQRDRRDIQAALHLHQLRGVMSTSACELGIDIPQFAFGYNVGVPPTRKSLRQRSGRIGRSQPGAFAVSAPAAAFTKLGSSLREVSTGEVEPSPLYLENPVIQFQQACCYASELGLDDVVPELDPRLEWPAGFSSALAMALPGAERPRILDDIAAVGFENPHWAFPMRSMPGVSYQLKDSRTGDLIGTIDQEKALRECYPGGTYRHMGRPYRVLEWRSSVFEHAIRLKAQKSAETTQPIINYKVSASVDAGALLDGHFLVSNEGCLAETQLHVVESVEGYRLGSTALLYKELRQTNPRLMRKQREFLTTGVVLRIAAPWFAGSSEHQVAARKTVASAIEQILCSEYGVASSDLRTAHTGISLRSVVGAHKVDDAIVLFDTVAGGLRLSEPVFTRFAQFLERLSLGADLAGSEALLSRDTVARLFAWHGKLQSHTQSAARLLTPDGKLLVFEPGSKVAISLRGELRDRVLLEPELKTIDEDEELVYRYETAPGVSAWVRHDRIEPAGGEWTLVLWDPLTNVYSPAQ